MYSLKEKMHVEFSKNATFSHASLALLNCKHELHESLTAFIYRWGELFFQSCGITSEQYRNKIKIFIFLSVSQ